MAYAGVIIRQKDGKFAFQLRDNDPKTTNPGKWGIFGGSIERNESPKEAAVRELREELGLEIRKDQLKSLLFIPPHYVFKLDLDRNLYGTRILEGAEIGLFAISDILKKKNLIFRLRLFLLAYRLLSGKIGGSQKVQSVS